MRECPFLVVIVHSVTINFVSTLFIAEFKAAVSGQTRIALCIFISEITAREATNWQDQIISLKSAKKNWRGRKRKRKRDNSNWIKPLSNQKTIKTSPMMKTRIYRHRAAHCWFMQPRGQHPRYRVSMFARSPESSAVSPPLFLLVAGHKSDGFNFTGSPNFIRRQHNIRTADIWILFRPECCRSMGNTRDQIGRQKMDDTCKF